VTVGFTAGIAVVIFAIQIKDLFGITLAKEPGELTHGVRPPRAKFRESIARAVADIKGASDETLVAKDGLAAG
jgi:SulP family sulfate permease